MNKRIFYLISLFFLCVQAEAFLGKRETSETVLYNEHFKYGTYIIDKPGRYRLGEDISFNPNSVATLNDAIETGVISERAMQRMGLNYPVDAYHASFPLSAQYVRDGVDSFSPGGPLDGRYDPSAFGLGFFAAIVITADGVTFDLAGHTLEQSAEHALLQRFFAVIELAEQPFIPGQGPADFGERIQSAKNVVIKNGTIGRSSHHGIHGNDNKNIQIQHVDFVDYEVAALALNGVDGLMVKHVNAENRKDVPVIGTFSSAQFIKPYIDELYRNNSETTLNVDGKVLSVSDIRSQLQRSINVVYEDVVIKEHRVDGIISIDKNAHADEYALFHNAHGVVDGNSYSFVVNPLGVAVNGFPERENISTPAKNIWFEQVNVDNQGAFINEVVALSQGDGPVIDPVGAVFQTHNRHPHNGQLLTISDLQREQARYVGNVIANAQAFVAKAHLNGEFNQSRLDLSRLSIDETILRWVEAQMGFETLSDVAPTDGHFLCNGDSMFHVNKGVIAFKMDGAKNIVLRNVSANNIWNLGKKGSAICGDYEKSHPAATLTGYGGAYTRGYTFAGSKNVILSKSTARNIASLEGDAIGVDILTDSKRALLKNVEVSEVDAGINESAFDTEADAPVAIGFHFSEGARKIKGKKVCAELLSGMGGEFMIHDESEKARMKKVCE